MTEIAIVLLLLLLTAAVWLVRALRRAWAKARGVEHDASREGPLPIVRAGELLRLAWHNGWARLKRWRKTEAAAKPVGTE